MDSLIETLRQVIEGYTGKGWNAHAYLSIDAERNIFTVISVDYIRGQRSADANIIVRLSDDKIIIERDMNSDPLVDTLLQAGIPRNKIILAYAGEPVPETSV